MPTLSAQAVLDHYDLGTLWSQERAHQTDLHAAYQTARQLRALREARGEQVKGYKIGFTNRTIWERYQVFAPIWGPVWDTTLRFCEGRGTVSLDKTSLPRLEPEVVFGFVRTPPPQPTERELFDCLEWIAAGFEVVQSHCADWKFTAAETIADGALHARLLVGQRVSLHTFATDPAALNARLASAQMTLLKDGVAVDRGTGAHVLDSPFQALRHFVGEFERQSPDTKLLPGDVVTTGTWTDAWPVKAGEQWQLELDALDQQLVIDFS